MKTTTHLFLYYHTTSPHYTIPKAIDHMPTMSAGSGNPCLLCPHNASPLSILLLSSNAFFTHALTSTAGRAIASQIAANNTTITCKREEPKPAKMVTFKVPSASPPSTPGSAKSPRGPNTFRVPSATPSEEGDDEASPVTPRPTANGPNTFRVPSASSPEGDDDEDDISEDEDGDEDDPPLWPPGSSSSSSQRQRPRFVPLAREREPSSSASPPKRSASPSPEERGALRRRRGRYDLRPMTREERIERARTPVPGSLFYGVEVRAGEGEGDESGRGGSPADEGEDEDEDEPASDDPAPKPEHPETPPSQPSSLDVSEKEGEEGEEEEEDDDEEEEEEVLIPLVQPQPSRTRGKLGREQPKRQPNNLTLLSERPGKLPEHTARSPTSPGFDWGDGAAWWYPGNSHGTREIAQEIMSASGYKDIRAAEVEAAAELMDHENLIRILDWDGFDAPAQTEGREEVLYQFCSGGTLNKLLLSRRPERPVLKPRRPATYLPTRERVLGLPEDLVWHVLISLLRATSWLHHRRRPVVHCGIDPANVFFTAPQPGDRRPLVRRYGLVKLGGFSRAVILPYAFDPKEFDDEAMEDRCELFEHMIQEPYAETGFEAPELLGMLGESESHPEKIVPGPGSDLYSVGATCFAMMTGKTVWDSLLERRFVARAGARGRVDGAVLEEKWRFCSYEERVEVLRAAWRGDIVLSDALPEFYSVELRDLVERLLNFDAEARLESAMMLDDVEEAFAEKCEGGEEAALEGTRRMWREVVGRPTASDRMLRAIEGEEKHLAPQREGMRRALRSRDPLVP